LLFRVEKAKAQSEIRTFAWNIKYKTIAAWNIKLLPDLKEEKYPS
jgi:hypothetical protein